MDEAQQAAGDSVAGQRIGKYQLIQRLARGGMAELFVARVSGLEGFQKICAIKRILPHLAGDADFVEMFLAEARLAATLEHPNIVPVFDFGRADNDYFFAMPYVHGKDLLAILRESQRQNVALPLAQAVAIATGVAAGLHYTHDQVGYDGEPLGIVHRDISPANVLVTFDGHVKVADFGIAKAAAQTSVTKVGVRKGKAAYMSPEQVRGDPIDRRSDLFSIGVVLWEMLTMRRLFRGDNDLAIMHRITSEAAPLPSTAAAGVPPELDAILARCLHPDVQQRYQTALQLQRDLETFAADAGLSTAARPLAAYLHSIFGDQDPPWASSLAMAVPDLDADSRDALAGSSGKLAAPIVGVGAFVAGSGTDHTHRTEEVTHSEDLDGFLARPPAWRGALLGAGVGGLGLAAWLVATPSPADPAAAPAVVIVSATATEPAAPSGRDRTDLLNLVNQPDWTLALHFERRHIVLDRLGEDSALAAAIDARLNVALDLVQAQQSPAPCETYSRALQSIEARPDAYYVPALRTADPPTGTRGCEGELSSRRAALLARLAPGTPVVPTPIALDPGGPPAVVTPAPVVSKKKKQSSKPAPAKPKPKPTPKPKPKPKPTGGKSGDGLRPFGG